MRRAGRKSGLGVELDLLGLNADPVQEFEIDETLPSDEFGSTAKRIHPTDVPTIDTEVVACSYHVEDGEASPVHGEEEDEVNITRSQMVEVKLVWTVADSEDAGNISEFHIRGAGDNVEELGVPFDPVSIDIEEGPGDGSISLYMEMTEGEIYPTYCNAMGEQAGPQALLYGNRENDLLAS